MLTKMGNKKIFLLLISFVFLVIAWGFYVYPESFNRAMVAWSGKIGGNIPVPKNGSYGAVTDLRSGVRLEYKADLSSIPEKEKLQVMEGLRDIIERRINIIGTTEPVIQIYGQDEIVIELPGVEDIDQAIKWVEKTPLLEFYEEDAELAKKQEEIGVKVNEVREKNKGKTEAEITDEIKKIPDFQFLYILPYKKTELTGRYLQKAIVSNDPTTYAPIIELQFNEEGERIFEEITKRNIGKTIAIFLDGNSIIDTTGDGKIDSNDLYAPSIEEAIEGGKAVISGKISMAEAKTLAQRLNQGVFLVPLSLTKSIKN